jgi:homoserine acetyltransferase
MQDRGNIATKLITKGCRNVDPMLVNRMQAMVTYRTDAALNARFGISYNTWRKLIAGEPVRASLISRLEARIDRLEAQSDGAAVQDRTRQTRVVGA